MNLYVTKWLKKFDALGLFETEQASVAMYYFDAPELFVLETIWDNTEKKYSAFVLDPKGLVLAQELFSIDTLEAAKARCIGLLSSILTLTGPGVIETPVTGTPRPLEEVLRNVGKTPVADRSTRSQYRAESRPDFNDTGGPDWDFGA